MAEIPALTAARAFAAQGDARIQRELQEENRARLELQRQQEIDARSRAAAEQLARGQQQLETLRNDLRVAEENRVFFRAQEDLRAFNDLDQRLLLAERQATEDNLEARALRAFEDEAPAPAARQPSVGLLTLDEIAAGLAVEQTDVGSELAFQALEDERLSRLSERRDAERDAAIQLRIDLQIAADRVATTPPDPGLPRGSIVDIFG